MNKIITKEAVERKLQIALASLKTQFEEGKLSEQEYKEAVAIYNPTLKDRESLIKETHKHLCGLG